MGRPSSYKPDFPKQAEKFAKLGATDVELADFFEVSVTTIHNWQTAHPEFLDAPKAGKDTADDRVERSLFHRAVGYTYDSEKVFQFQSQVIRAPIREHVPPDTTAAIFWLKNGRKAEWRDRTEQITGTPDDFARMSEAELEAFITERMPERPSKPRWQSLLREGAWSEHRWLGQCAGRSRARSEHRRRLRSRRSLWIVPV